MKKVLLINSNTEVLPYPVAPLGLSLIASSLEKNYKVKIFDLAFKSTSDLIDMIMKYLPDYIGIGIRNIDNVTMQKSKWYLKEIKDNVVIPVKTYFDIPIIVGGSGVSIAPKQILDFLDVDYAICGEAEESFIKLLNTIDTCFSVTNIDGVIARNSKEFTFKKYKAGVLKIPFANVDSYLNFDNYKEKGNYPVQTKRGCSHKCIYCSYPIIEGNKYRLRPVKEIIDEIEEVQKRIPNISFEFVDSTFNSPLNHAVNICNEIINRNLDVKLRTMGVNPGEVTEELIILMKKAGFSQIDCTPDSASEIMLKSYRKNFNKKKLIECANIIKKYNMPTMWFFMIGAPGETEDTILETFEFIDKHIYHEDMVHITEGIRIIPNTELYKLAVKQNVISEKQSVIKPMYYVDPNLGNDDLTRILNLEISKRSNVLNSINTSPNKELMKAAIAYRKKNMIEEPMFRTLLRVQASILK